MWTSAAILLVLVASLHGHPKGKLNHLGVEDPDHVTCRALKNLSESTDGRQITDHSHLLQTTISHTHENT